MAEPAKSAAEIKREIKDKTQLMLQSATNVNFLVDLIELSDTESEDILLCFIKSVHRICTRFMKENKIFPSKKRLQEEAENGNVSDTVDDPENVFKSWMHEQYLNVIKKLLECMHKKSRNVQELALCTLMKFLVAESKAKASDEKKSPFPNNVFGKIFDQLVHPSIDMKEIIERFSEYLEYDDVRFYVLKNLSRVIESQSQPGNTNENNYLSTNAYAILSRVTIPSSEEEIGNFLINEGKVATNMEGAKNTKSSKGANCLNAHKKVFGSAWLGLLSLPLTPDIHKKVLLNLHNSVIPHLNDPKMLMDFLSDSYDIGGAISLLALNGLFILIHQYNLDYPDFYKKLYALLQPGVFHARYLPRFFRLLDLFLSSTHLPAYLVAAFAKRLSGLALSAPPQGIMLVICFVSNLLKRHPSCQVLIHRKQASKLLLTGDNTEALNGAGKGDPFIPDEADPAKCNALQSSLWELKTLQHHCYPDISTLVQCLEKPFGKEEVDIEDYLNVGYQDLFEKQCTSVTHKNAVMEYQPPKGILGTEFLDMWNAK